MKKKKSAVKKRSYKQQPIKKRKKKSSLPVEVFDMREAMVFFLVANSISKLL